MVVIKRKTTMPDAMPHPIIAWIAGFVGINPTKPCKIDRHAMAIPYWTVLDFRACFNILHLYIVWIIW